MTKDIEREAFEALPLAKLALSQDWVRYKKESNTYYPNEDFCPESAPETINFAWQSWQAAKAHEAEKLKGCVVVPETEFALLPKTITPVIEEILGMPCFKFIKAAQIYRQLGFDIPPKAEKEQAFFMFKFLHLALIHGDKCFDVFEAETKAMVEAARGGNE